MISLKTKLLYQKDNITKLPKENHNSLNTEGLESFSSCNINNLQSQNNLMLDMLDNLKKYVNEPLKEGLLLINIIETHEDKDDNLTLIYEIKNFIKMGLNNCNDILKCGFDITKCKAGNKGKKSNIIQGIWNSKLFIDISTLVQKLFTQKQINPSSEEAILCISEIYNYSVNAAGDSLDPHFAEWIIERFLNETQGY